MRLKDILELVTHDLDTEARVDIATHPTISCHTAFLIHFVSKLSFCRDDFNCAFIFKKLTNTLLLMTCLSIIPSYHCLPPF